METIRKVGNFSLNKDVLNQWNISNQILMDLHPKGGVSLFFDAHEAKVLQKLDDEDFLEAAAEMIEEKEPDFFVDDEISIPSLGTEGKIIDVWFTKGWGYEFRTDCDGVRSAGELKLINRPK